MAYPTVFPIARSGFQHDHDGRLLLKAEYRDARGLPGNILLRILQEVLQFLDRLSLNASRISPAEKPALAASLVSGTSSRITPVSPGLPAAETSPRPTMLRTFAPAQTATSRLRVSLRVGVVSLDL